MEPKKISDVIKELQDLLEAHGDLEVGNDFLRPPRISLYQHHAEKYSVVID
jgi:hypothetical protein